MKEQSAPTAVVVLPNEVPEVFRVVWTRFRRRLHFHGEYLVAALDDEVNLTLCFIAPVVKGWSGRVVILARDTIVLRDGGTVSRFAIDDLSAIEVRGGENKRRGFLIGAGVATGITGIFGGIDASKGRISNDDLIGTLIVNALIGGLVGYAFAPKGWERIPLPGAGP